MDIEIWRAVFETPSFRFESYGVSREHAFKALEKGWSFHAEKNGASPDYLAKYAEDVGYDTVKIGECMRDGQIFWVE